MPAINPRLCSREIAGQAWVLGSNVLGADDRICQFASLVEGNTPTCIITDDGPIINPQLGDLERAKKFNGDPWGNVFVPFRLALAIRNWRNQHEDPNDVPDPT